MRLVVTGSRFWANRIRLVIALNRARLHCAAKGEPFEIAFGDCPTGADEITWDWARHWQLGFRRFEIPRRSDGSWIGGKEQGPLRNRRMVDQFQPDWVLACLLDEHLGASKGTRGCRDYAVSQGARPWDLIEPPFQGGT